MKSRSTEYAFLTHFTNKEALQAISIQLNQYEADHQSAEQEDNTLLKILSQIESFKTEYKTEVDGLHDKISELSTDKRELSNRLEIQALQIEQLITRNEEDVVARHRAEYQLKQLQDQPPHGSVGSTSPSGDKRVTILDQGSPSPSPTGVQPEPATRPEFVIQNDLNEELIATARKNESQYQSDIRNLEFRVKVMTKQLEVEEAKVKELSSILEDYHTKERARTEALRSEKEADGRSIASRHSSAPRVRPMGSSADFFEEMFGEPKVLQLATQMRNNGFVSSALDTLRIETVNREGFFIRIKNADPEKDEEIGMYVIQQKVNGVVIASYRFPDKAKLRAGQSVNVWAASSLHKRSSPPTDYIWREQHRVGYGLECTTILTRPNGQAIAWYCGQHRYNGEIEEFDDTAILKKQRRLLAHTESQVSSNELLTLRREKTVPAVLYAHEMKHPHGSQTHLITHPSTDTTREKSLGNDQSSLMRQTRLSRTPDYVPELYAGAARTGARSHTYVREPTVVYPMRSTPAFMKKLISAGAS